MTESEIVKMCFVIEKCKREAVPDAVEFIGAYIKYLEEKVNE